MYIRHKTTPDGRRYYSIVKTVQIEGGSRQKVVKYLGTVEKIMAVFEKYEEQKGKKNGSS